MPKGERFYYRHRNKVIDGTTCDEEKLDVCVDGKCSVIPLFNNTINYYLFKFKKQTILVLKYIIDLVATYSDVIQIIINC